ncbi:bcl-2 homologous antagonist/killer [Ammospiza nelsoni]|uniref:bcl-2 homologous antagonist/killer n=1 Tax=Ammospiza caudacuta TaxID=2857398 RepID=UPI0027398D96|nr:bcl-2 homologous antagonist/killer [Ammospiza caudacuta]XP_059344126.1 bcl-2 homologous antagonist/killer [Ammospiza nelsoni]
MASGNEGNEERRGSHGLSSEGRVAEEAEEVFRSYAFYRYQQERQECGAELPRDPEIEQIQQDLESTGSQVGQRLAIIGDDIYRRYDPEFLTMLEILQPTRHNAYETFTKIASSLFESGINWGRVIALLAFGYRLAMHVWQRGVSGFLRRIARYVGEFMLQHRIARWIAQQGGWEAVQNLDNVYVKYLLVVAVVVVLGHLVLRRFLTP